MFQLFVIRSLKHRATIRYKKAMKLVIHRLFFISAEPFFDDSDSESDRAKEGKENKMNFCEVDELKNTIEQKIDRFVFMVNNGVPSFFSMVPSPTSSIISMPDHEGTGSDPAHGWNRLLTIEQENREFVQQYQSFVDQLPEEKKIVFHLHYLHYIPGYKLREGITYQNRFRTFYNVYQIMDEILLWFAVLDPEVSFSMRDLESYLLERMHSSDPEKRMMKLTEYLFQEYRIYQELLYFLPEPIADVMRRSLNKRHEYNRRDYDKKRIGLNMIRYLVPRESIIWIDQEQFNERMAAIPKTKRYRKEFIDHCDALFSAKQEMKMVHFVYRDKYNDLCEEYIPLSRFPGFSEENEIIFSEISML